MKLFELNYGTSEYFEKNIGDKYYFKDLLNVYIFIENQIRDEFDIKNENTLYYMLDTLENYKDKLSFQMNFYDQENRSTELYINIDEIFTID